MSHVGCDQSGSLQRKFVPRQLCLFCRLHSCWLYKLHSETVATAVLQTSVGLLKNYVVIMSLRCNFLEVDDNEASLFDSLTTEVSNNS